LAPFAATISSAVRCATTFSPLGATLQLTLSLADALPPCVAPFTAATHPLSVLNNPLVHTGHHTHDGGSARAGQRCSVSRARWSRALGRGTYGGCVVGEDGKGLLRTLHRQVRRLLARRAASPNLMVGSNTRPHHTAARRPHHDGGTPWSTCCSEGAGVRELSPGLL
jgi:hypothetical protein